MMKRILLTAALLALVLVCAGASAEETRHVETEEAFRSAFEELADGMRTGFTIDAPTWVFQRVVRADNDRWGDFYNSCGVTGYRGTSMESGSRTALTFETVDYYAGRRIWAAVSGGRESLLTDAERRALRRAREVAAGAAGTALQRERYLHDWLCSHVTYYTDSIDHNENDCALGALLDGRADCDGYSDAFFLLCWLSDVPCRYVSGSSDSFRGQPNTAHMWNAVFVGGTWVMVDVTWDDQDDRISYGYYNIGADRLRRNHRWPADRLTFTAEPADRADLRDRDQPLITASTLPDLDVAMAEMRRRQAPYFCVVLGGQVTVQQVQQYAARHGVNEWHSGSDACTIEFYGLTWHEHFLYTADETEAAAWINGYAARSGQPAELVLMFEPSLGRRLFAGKCAGLEHLLYGTRLATPADWSYSDDLYCVYLQHPAFTGAQATVISPEALLPYLRSAAASEPSELSFMIGGSLTPMAVRSILFDNLYRCGVMETEGWYLWGDVRVQVLGIRYYPEYRIVQTRAEALSYLRDCRWRGVSACRVYLPDSLYAQLMADSGRGVFDLLEEAGWPASGFSYSSTCCAIILGE